MAVVFRVADAFFGSAPTSVEHVQIGLRAVEAGEKKQMAVTVDIGEAQLGAGGGPARPGMYPAPETRARLPSRPRSIIGGPRRYFLAVTASLVTPLGRSMKPNR